MGLENKATVTVVTPAYNAEKFIAGAIKSCLGQTFRPLEVIVVNDGSTDSTPEIVEKITRTMPSGKLELKLIDVHPNQGAANALRVGFSNAQGKFICWLSADDMFIDREKVAKQVHYMKKTNAAWSYFSYSYAGASLSQRRLVKPSYLPLLSFLDPLFVRDADLRLMILLFKSPINGSSIMIKKDAVEKYGSFDPATRNVDGDGDLWMRYSALGLKLTALKGASVFYREHAMQTTRKELAMLYGCDLTRIRMLAYLEKKGKLVKLVKKFAPFLPILVETNYHLARPFVSQRLFSYVLNHSKEFGRILPKCLAKPLRQVEKQIERLKLNKEEFKKQADAFNQSLTFQNFEQLDLK
jgi:glycosyltransferase involved in cell wall biosynthesis